MGQVKKQSRREVEIRGERMSLVQAVERYATDGLSYNSVFLRYYVHHWRLEDALRKPPGRRLARHSVRIAAARHGIGDD